MARGVTHANGIRHEELVLRISGSSRETFLYLNGLGAERAVSFSENVELQPACCEPTPDTIIALCKSELDIGVAAIFLRQVTSQLHVTAGDPEQLAKTAWNAVWYSVLLSALYDCDVVCNFQCDVPTQDLSASSCLEVTNYNLRGLSTSSPRVLGGGDLTWIEEHMQAAWRLLDADPFQSAVHSLASYRWNPHPRVQLAVLWAGIEGLFQIESEFAFRISPYAARFLAPNDEEKRRTTFANVRSLYKARSKAVHGMALHADTGNAIVESAQLLSELVRTCIVSRALPSVDVLAP